MRVILFFLFLSASIHASSLEEALLECFPSVDQNEIHVKELAGGLSEDKKYLITVNDQKYALKHFVHSSRTEQEQFMLQFAGELGIGPKVYHIANDKSFVLMEFLEGGTISFSEVRTAEACVGIAKGIKALHDASPQVWIHYEWVPLYTDLYNNLVQKAGEKPEFDDAIAMMREAYVELDKLSNEKVNTHCDLSARNIFLIGGQAKFVDWADANYHDPFYDLAFFSMMSAYDHELDTLLLRTYLNREIEISDWKKFHYSKLIAYATVILSAYQIIFESDPMAKMNDDHLSYDYLIQQFVDYADSSNTYLMNLAQTFMREGKSLALSLLLKEIRM